MECRKTHVVVFPTSLALHSTGDLTSCLVSVLPGETVLVDALFLSQIWQAHTEFGQSPRRSPFFIWKARKPCPSRVCYLLILFRYIQFELCPHKDDALKVCLFPSLFLVRLLFFHIFY
jgi:hypothetical protein